MEKDINDVVTNYGPHLLIGIFFQYSIISSDDLEIMQHILKLLPSEKADVILIDIITQNVKNPVTYDDFINCLEQVTPLKHLYKKIILIGK